MAEAAPSEAFSQAGQTRPPSRSISLYLFILALVALVPAFIFSAILLQRNNEAQERVVEELVVGNARSIVEVVEREIAANITTLRLLSTDPTLLDNDLASFHERVTTALAGTGAFVYLLDANLISILNTRTAYGEPGRPSNDPETSRRVLEGDQVVVSNLVYSPVYDIWAVNVLQPVEVPGRGRLVLGFNRSVEVLSGALLANKMPEGWHVALLDRGGQVIAASDSGQPVGQPFHLADIDTLGAAPRWTAIEADARYVAAVQRSALTGWTLVAWAPRDVVTRPLSDAFWSLLVGGILLAATVVLILYWVGLQIGRSVRGLEDDARLLGAGEAVVAHPYPISEIATVSTAIADASARRKAAELEVRLLMREVAHRSKNQMTVITAMAKQTAKGAESVPEFVHSFERRIFGLARSTDLLLAHGAAGVDLQELLTLQLDPFWPDEPARVSLDGPPIRINPQAAQILGMAAHELGANAVKFGAFSTDTGTLAIRWGIVGPNLEFHWRETQDRAPGRARRRGFGTTVLENMVGRSLGAEVTRTETASGIEWGFLIPTAALDPHASTDP